MPSIYDITYSKRVVELLPPDKRYEKAIAWWTAMVQQLQYLHTDVLVDFRVGSNYPVYSAGSYNLGDRVIFGQSVYESLVSANTAVPTDAAKWKLYQLYFLGVDDRIKYNGQSLVLDYATNQRFKTNFRQPPLQSDIYFTVNTPSAGVFVVGGDELNSSISWADRSDEFIINLYSFTSFYNMTVHVPIAVFTALSTDAAAREKIISGFIDNILPSGIRYNIITY